jgi:hypothetical protein
MLVRLGSKCALPGNCFLESRVGTRLLVGYMATALHCLDKSWHFATVCIELYASDNMPIDSRAFFFDSRVEVTECRKLLCQMECILESALWSTPVHKNVTFSQNLFFTRFFSKIIWAIILPHVHQPASSFIRSFATCAWQLHKINYFQKLELKKIPLIARHCASRIRKQFSYQISCRVFPTIITRNVY